MPRMVELHEMLDLLMAVYYDTPDDFTDWEANFVSNILKKDTDKLTDKQLDNIERLYFKFRSDH